MIRRGFTGTRRPPTGARETVTRHLLTLNPSIDELVVGCAIGIDELIGEIGHGLGFNVHGVLPYNRSQVSRNWKLWCSSYEEMPQGTNYFQRNERLVQISTDLTAFPIAYLSNSLTGGTWDTVRRARRIGIPVKIISLEV